MTRFPGDHHPKFRSPSATPYYVMQRPSTCDTASDGSVQVLLHKYIVINIELSNPTLMPGQAALTSCALLFGTGREVCTIAAGFRSCVTDGC